MKICNWGCAEINGGYEGLTAVGEIEFFDTVTGC